MKMNTTLRNLTIGLAAALALAASVGATTVNLNPDDPTWGTVTFETNPLTGTLEQSHGGQTQTWGYAITYTPGQYAIDHNLWFVATGISAGGFNNAYASQHPEVFDFPVIAPASMPGDPYTAYYTVAPAIATGNLFQIQWKTGLPYVVDETGFFILSGEMWTGNSFDGLAKFADAAPVSTPYAASAPEPVSLILLGTAFSVAYWTRRRRKSA